MQPFTHARARSGTDKGGGGVNLYDFLPASIVLHDAYCRENASEKVVPPSRIERESHV